MSRQTTLPHVLPAIVKLLLETLFFRGGYHDLYQADEVLLKPRRQQREYLIDIEDAPVAVSNQRQVLTNTR
jgi:uncharacterized membrane protein